MEIITPRPLGLKEWMLLRTDEKDCLVDRELLKKNNKKNRGFSVGPRGQGMSSGEDVARTHVQNELGSNGLVVTDSVFHVAAVAVLGHLEPVTLSS